MSIRGPFFLVSRMTEPPRFETNILSYFVQVISKNGLKIELFFIIKFKFTIFNCFYSISINFTLLFFGLLFCKYDNPIIRNKTIPGVPISMLYIEILRTIKVRCRLTQTKIAKFLDELCRVFIFSENFLNHYI